MVSGGGRDAACSAGEDAAARGGGESRKKMKNTSACAQVIYKSMQFYVRNRNSHSLVSVGIRNNILCTVNMQFNVFLLFLSFCKPSKIFYCQEL